MRFPNSGSVSFRSLFLIPLGDEGGLVFEAIMQVGGAHDALFLLAFFFSFSFLVFF